MRENLVAYQERLLEDDFDCERFFNDDLIYKIVKNASYLKCEEDVLSVGLQKGGRDYDELGMAYQILEMIEKIEECDESSESD